ncbi:MAG: aldehyde dehydrogenase (NADP(+)) [Chitinophagaceae bacterium]|nr:aldehyde dehydrogenase (NADP(+)) [Chitinophagaceae bacterium]
MFKDATPEEINRAVQLSEEAFWEYRKLSLQDRKRLMYAIAAKLENSGMDIIHCAMEETNLPENRLIGERARTILQLRQYADACVAGDWLDVRIHKAKPDTGAPDIRKTKVPLGPVVVFGSSNFPFAYSTAGGDTATALAAGCTVIVKGHPAHAKTSQMVADLISEAVREEGMPENVFQHLHGISFEVGKQLVMHPGVKAVAFTGSLAGGKQLFDWGNQRKVPIPVFSEMGSTNPVFLLPGKLKSDAASIAKQYAASITQGVGQFCTNPGLILGIASEGLNEFKEMLKHEIRNAAPQKMLHAGIAKAYDTHKETALQQEGVSVLANSDVESHIKEGVPLVATVSGAEFIKNPLLKQEVFGPFSLVIECKDKAELAEAAKYMDGQLTSTIMGTENDIHEFKDVVSVAENFCGRLILNGVPTGVTVCRAMHHGGPFPATTDSRFTSVGGDAILRFVRPVAYQNWPDSLLPDELKDANPLGIERIVE